MAHTLVKIKTSDNGEIYHNPEWHLSIQWAATHMALCTMEAYGMGNSACEYEEKQVDRGVPCHKCKALIKGFKSIKL